MKYLKTFENFIPKTVSDIPDTLSDILFMVLKGCRMDNKFVSFENTPIPNLFKTLEEDGEDLNKMIKRIYDICVGDLKDVDIPDYKEKIKQSDWLYVLIYDIMTLLQKYDHEKLFKELMGDAESMDVFNNMLKNIFANVFLYYDRKNNTFFAKGKLTGLN